MQIALNPCSLNTAPELRLGDVYGSLWLVASDRKNAICLAAGRSPHWRCGSFGLFTATDWARSTSVSGEIGIRNCQAAGLSSAGGNVTLITGTDYRI